MFNRWFEKNYLLWIAWRNLKSQRKKSALSFMTTFSIIGVTLGVAVLMTVLSVMGGFEADLVSKMLRGQPHLEVMAENAIAGFSLNEFPVEKLQERVPEATHTEPFTQADVVLKQRRHLASANLFGVDPERQGHLWAFGSSMVEGSMNDLTELHPPYLNPDPEAKKYPGIILGIQLAAQLGADVGDEVVVLSPQANMDAALAGSTVSRTYVVVGKFETNLFNYDARWAVVRLEEGRKFLAGYDQLLDEENYVSGVAFNIEDPQGIDAPAARLAEITGLKALSWKVQNKSLLFALKLEKFAMGSILMLIVVVAAFSISGTLMMTVYHRRMHICLFRSLGMTKRDVAKLYLMHGFTIGSVGVTCGILLGLLLCSLIHVLFVSLPSGVYYLKSLPVRFLPMEYGVIAICALGFSLIAALYPAVTAARQDPSAGLRYS